MAPSTAILRQVKKVASSGLCDDLACLWLVELPVVVVAWRLELSELKFREDLASVAAPEGIPDIVPDCTRDTAYNGRFGRGVLVVGW
jgi:hypothetical protein